MSSLGSSILDFNSVICGHHVYKDVWTPFIGEELTVQPDNDNEDDDYAVGVLKDGAVVGHVTNRRAHCLALHSTRRGDFL